MSEFDKIMADTQEKIDFHTEQYNSLDREDEVHTHTSGGTYFGDSISDDVSVSSESGQENVVLVDKDENVENKEVSGFDYFIFFGLIIMVIILIINKIRSKKQ